MTHGVLGVLLPRCIFLLENIWVPSSCTSGSLSKTAVLLQPATPRATRQLFLPSKSQASADLLSGICMSQVSQELRQTLGQKDSQWRPSTHRAGASMSFMLCRGGCHQAIADTCHSLKASDLAYSYDYRKSARRAL